MNSNPSSLCSFVYLDDYVQVVVSLKLEISHCFCLCVVLLGQPPFGLPPIGLRGHLDYSHLDYPHLDYPQLDYPQLDYPHLDYPQLGWSKFVIILIYFVQLGVCPIGG